MEEGRKGGGMEGRRGMEEGEEREGQRGTQWEMENITETCEREYCGLTIRVAGMETVPHRRKSVLVATAPTVAECLALAGA